MSLPNVLVDVPQVEGLEFDEKTHIYRLNGIIIPSVSAIMEPLSNAKYANISESTLDRAAEKGTSVHNSIENWIKFGFMDVEPEYAGYFEAFTQWFEEYSPSIVASEVRVCNRLMMYAGTVDLIAYIDNKLTLVDYKSTYTLSKMTCGVQLEAYARALSSKGVEVEKKSILHLKKDGKFEFVDFPVKDADRWRVFGALKTVYDYIQISK